MIRFETENRTKTKSMACIVNEQTNTIVEIEKVEIYKHVESTKVIKRYDIQFDEYFKEFLTRYYKTTSKDQFIEFTSHLKQEVLDKYFQQVYIPKQNGSILSMLLFQYNYLIMCLQILEAMI